jgi:hypothetical protein
MDPHIMEWLSLPLARALLLLALLSLLFAWFSCRRLRPYRLLSKALSAGGKDGKQVPVGYFSQEDLAGGRLHARYAKPAMLVADGNGDIGLYILTRGEACLHYRFSPSDTGYEWYRSMLGGLLPPLLGLRADGRTHYLFKCQRLAGTPLRSAGKFYTELADFIPNLPAPRTDGFRYVEWGIRLYALLLVGAVIAAVAASWSPGLDEEPMVLGQQQDGHVYAASVRWLYHFDAADQLVERIDLQSLGIDNGISDIELLEDGRFLVGDSGAGLIKSCDFSTRQCQALAGFGEGKFFLRSFQFARAPQHDRIYAADSSRHRLLELDASGNLIKEIAGHDSLCFPNDPLVTNGMLVIANTNHHKLVAWDLAQPGFEAPAQEWLTVQAGRDDVRCPSIFEAPNTEYFAREMPQSGGSRAVVFNNARPGKIWPFVIQQGPQGGMWVLNAGNNLQHADLLIFDQWPSDSKPRRVYLEDGVDPIGMLVRSNDVLLAENHKPSIIRISHEGRVLGDFGDAEFSGLMTAIADRQQLYKQVSLYAKYTVGVLLLVLVIALRVISALRIQHIQRQNPSFTSIADGKRGRRE